jgi:hypothetical protein
MKAPKQSSLVAELKNIEPPLPAEIGKLTRHKIVHQFSILTAITKPA